MEWLELGLKYGIGGLAFLGVIILTRICFKLERRVKENESKNNIHHETLETRRGYHTDAFNRLEKLESKNVKFDGEFNNINTKLKHLDTNVGLIRTDVQAILQHFAHKGMDHV